MVVPSHCTKSPSSFAGLEFLASSRGQKLTERNRNSGAICRLGFAGGDCGFWCVAELLFWCVNHA